MKWYYAVGQQQQGPLDDTQLDALLAAGTVTPDTLIWREGQANWQPLRVARPGFPVAPPGAVPAAAPPGQVPCAECRAFFPKEDTIQYGSSFVCAACKPIFVQRLREGAPMAASGGASINEEQLLSGEYRVELGDCLDRAWKIFTANSGLVIGTTLLIGLVAAVCWGVTMAASLLIPVAGQLVSIFFAGPLMGGYLWFFLRLGRGEQASVGDAFAGLSRHFGSLVMASIVQGLIGFVCMLPFTLMGVLGTRIGQGGQGAQANFTMLAGLGLAGLVGFAVMIYLNTLWSHSLLLIVDKGYKFWPAMELSRKLVRKRWWMTFLFMLVSGLIGGIGALAGLVGFLVTMPLDDGRARLVFTLLACLMGLLVTMPLYFAMRSILYDDNFRNLQPAG